MIIGNTLKRIFGKKSNILFMVVIPIVLDIFLISSSTSTVSYDIAVVDNDATQYSQQIVSTLAEDNDVTMLDNVEEINELIINRSIDCAIVFYDGFTQDLIDGKEDVKVESYSVSGTNSYQPIFMRINSYITAGRQIAKAVDGDEAAFYKGLDDYDKGNFGAEYKTFTINDEKTVEKAVTSLGYLALGMVFLMIFSTILILEDKVSGVFDRVAVSPLKASSYLAQHTFSYFIVAFIQIYTLLAIVPKVINISYGATPAERYQVLIVCCAFALVCISIGVTISRFSKSILMAGTITSLINLPMLMLGGCLWPREIMPESVQKIGNIMPTTWFLKAGEDVLYGRGVSAAANEILYMILFAVVLLVICFVVKTEKER